MTRTQYKNNHIKEHYDRINLCIPKGQKAKIRAVADNMQVSVNEYLFMLICDDLRYGESRILQSKQVVSYGMSYRRRGSKRKSYIIYADKFFEETGIKFAGSEVSNE